jgi:hypothetical protein
MKLRFKAQKGDRINKQMMGFEAIGLEWVWNCDLKEWTKEINNGEYSYSSHRPCKSVRAFRRMLKSSPKGVEFKLWNRYIGRNVYGTGDKL